MIKVWDIVTDQFWVDEDGKPLVYRDEEHAKDEMRKEGFKEAYIETAVEFYPHTPIDQEGYDLR